MEYTHVHIIKKLLICKYRMLPLRLNRNWEIRERVIPGAGAEEDPSISRGTSIHTHNTYIHVYALCLVSTYIIICHVTYIDP